MELCGNDEAGTSLLALAKGGQIDGATIACTVHAHIPNLSALIEERGGYIDDDIIARLMKAHEDGAAFKDALIELILNNAHAIAHAEEQLLHASNSSNERSWSSVSMPAMATYAAADVGIRAIISS